MTSVCGPLNGSRTHPLSAHALDVLRRMRDGRAVPRQEINPGVVNRFLRESLVQSVWHPIPYKTHRGKEIEHLVITDAGRAAVQET